MKGSCWPRLAEFYSSHKIYHKVLYTHLESHVPNILCKKKHATLYHIGVFRNHFDITIIIIIIGGYEYITYYECI